MGTSAAKASFLVVPALIDAKYVPNHCTVLSSFLLCLTAESSWNNQSMNSLPNAIVTTSKVAAQLTFAIQARRQRSLFLGDKIRKSSICRMRWLTKPGAHFFRHGGKVHILPSHFCSSVER